MSLPADTLVTCELLSVITSSSPSVGLSWFPQTNTAGSPTPRPRRPIDFLGNTHQQAPRLPVHAHGPREAAQT